MTSISTAGQAQQQLQNLQNILTESDTLETQAASGKKTTTIAGLGAEALPDVQANAGLASLTNYNTNITNGQTKLNVMSTAMQQIQTEVNSVVSAMDAQNQNGNTDMSSLNSLAKQALSFVNNLLNQKEGGDYVFAGSDSSTAPLGSQNQLNTYSQTNINKWINGTITTAQLMSSYNDPTQMTDSTMGYSSSLSSGQAGAVAIKADDNADVDCTVLANNPSLRNTVAALTTLINVTSTVTSIQSTTPPTAGAVTAPGATPADQATNFYQVFNDLTSQLSNASTGITQLNQKIGYAQSTLQTISTQHTTDENTLQTTISGDENADLNTVATQLSTLQNQLSASYSIMASLQKYSLANYLTGA